MKSIAYMLAAAMAALAARMADANGVCYDPTHGSTATSSSISSDMSTIKGYGFDTVRTYVSYYGSINVGNTITAAGLTAALGVPYPDDWSTHAQYAIAAANAGGVSHIFVGNENLAGASSVPSAMISAIEYIKSQVGSGVKVGTVQRNTEVIGYSSISGWSDLVSACDVLGVNVHPFFTSGTSAENAMALVKTQWNTMYANFGSKLLLTETGWPTEGSYGSNTGSVSGLQTFYSDYQSWMSSQSQSFFFQMFDTPYKSETYEQTFGLLTYDSQNKFTMSSSPTSAPSTTSPATTSPATSAPATTAPATTAPATTAPATSTPEPTTATPEPTTETPDLSSTDSSASTSLDADSTDGSSSLRGSVSSSSSGSVGSPGSVGGSGSDATVGSVGSSSTENGKEVGSSDDEVADEADTGDNGTVSTESTTSTGTAGTSDSTTDSQTTSGADGTQKANTQSEDDSGTSYVGLAVAGGACAAMVAFGFIYQTRKRAQEMEDLDDKRDDSFPSAVTPVENINVL